MLKLVKIAVGSAASIFLADMMGLSYSTAAGIITLLTIQDTSRETIAISVKRIFAFLLATFFFLYGFSACRISCVCLWHFPVSFYRMLCFAAA